jgi:hypothetical protein
MSVAILILMTSWMIGGAWPTSLDEVDFINSAEWKEAIAERG